MFKILKKWIRVYFGFSRTETNGTLVLIFLMIVFMVAPLAWERWAPQVQYDPTLDHQILDSVLAILDTKPAPIHKPKTPTTSSGQPAQIFYFDPNLASSEDFLALGLPDFVAKRIIKYRDNGGKFRIKSDLSKIYGLSPETYRRLHNYISLPERIETPVAPRAVNSKALSAKRPTAKLDINKADTLQLRGIRGIGQVRARRIVKYRDWLGGFVSTQQFQELWGFDSQVLLELEKATFIAGDFVPKKIDIDSGDVRTLAGHPYISYQLADVIIAYRAQHGPFGELQELQGIEIINDSLFNRISPYLKKSR